LTLALIPAVTAVVVAVITILAANNDSSVPTPQPSQNNQSAERVQACRQTHDLSRPNSERVLSAESASFQALFQACSWPPTPGADGDGFSEISVVTDDGPGRSEAEGLTVRHVFTSECSNLEAKYLFGAQGKLVPQKPLRLVKGTVVRVEDGSQWQPQTEAQRTQYAPGRDEFVVLGNTRYKLDQVRCV
jgi:hypothetical protein